MSQSELVERLRVVLSELRADMRALDDAYNRDGIAHVTANQIERIFDTWNHERADELDALLSEIRKPQEASGLPTTSPERGKDVSVSDRRPPRKYKGLGIGGFCIPEKSIRDHVTHGEMQVELRRLRSAIATLANCLGGNVLSRDAVRELNDLLKEPGER